MQEGEQDNINTEENDLQQNFQNNFAVPQPNVIPQYNIPQYIPQYAAPQYSVPQNVENTQVIQANNQIPVMTPQNLINDSQQIDQNNQIFQSNQSNQSIQVYQNKMKEGTPSPYEILSFLSWILFMGSKWDIYRKMGVKDNDDYQPILYNRSFIALITLIISFIAFLTYIKNIIYKRNINFYHSLFGQNTKYHFLPLILYSGINIVLSDEIIALMKKCNSYDGPAMFTDLETFDVKAVTTFYMIFSILSLLTLIYIYYSLEMNCEWYISMIIKKGLYSILIVECLYHFFDSIFYVRLMNISGSSTIKTLYNTGGIFFAILQSGLVICFSFYYKNIIMPIFNLVMYYSMVMNYFTKGNSSSAWKEDAVVGIEIAMIVATVIEIVYMIAKYKEKLIEP